MSATVRIIRVFVSAPGDVQAECDVLDEVVASINRSEGQARGVRLELLKWEEHVAPQIGLKRQPVADAQTPACDICVGIMSTRFSSGGTEQAFRAALAMWETAGTPWITFYFDDDPKVSRKPDEAKQFVRVCEFREELESKGLVATYASVRGGPDSFHEKVAEQLRQITHRQAPWQPGSPSTIEGKPAAKPTIPPHYIEWIQEQCGTLELLGLRGKHGSGVRLNQVYTPLATGDGKLLLHQFAQDSLYVSGDPGSGKSTFCRWVAWLACKNGSPSPEVPTPPKYQERFPASLGGRLPVLIRLRDFWRCLPILPDEQSMTLEQLADSLSRWLAQESPPGLDWECLRAHIENGSGLLIFDGLDEVPATSNAAGRRCYPRELLLAGLAAARNSWGQQHLEKTVEVAPTKKERQAGTTRQRGEQESLPGNRLLVTSRPYGLNEDQRRGLGMPHAAIRGLDLPLQELLVRRWFYRLNEDHAEGLRTAGEMIAHVRAERSLDYLSSNPLLLASLCIIYDEGQRLPQDKYELYDRLVDTVLHNRYPPSAKVQVSTIRGRLGAVALGLHTGGELTGTRTNPEAVAADSEIDVSLQNYRQQDGATEQDWRELVEVREELLSQSGLLVSHDHARAGFYHLSFQEFLAAERLFVLHARQPGRLLDWMLQRGTAAGWRNALSFLFGCLVSKFNLQAGVELLQGLAARIDGTVSMPAEDGALGELVGDCVAILVGRKVSADTLREIVQQLLESNASAIVRNVAMLRVGHLGDPRIVVDMRDRAAYVEVPAGEYMVGEDRRAAQIGGAFLLSRFPVTNAQYGLFIAAGGYRERPWWSNDGWQWRQQQQVTAPGYWGDAKWNGPNQPVVGVSWWEAEAFAKWAGGRLPTADESEAASRGPQGLEYPWGDRWEDGICNTSQAGVGSTSAVGIFPRSKSVPFALEDIAGNVWEWCADGDATRRVIRGGSWGYGARRCRAADRSWSVPRFRDVDLGFRVAAVPPGGQSRTSPPAEPGA